MPKQYSKPRIEPRPLPWERVTDNVSRLPVADGHLWKVNGETYFVPSVAYLERVVEAARKLEQALLKNVTKH